MAGLRKLRGKYYIRHFPRGGKEKLIPTKTGDRDRAEALKQEFERLECMIKAGIIKDINEPIPKDKPTQLSKIEKEILRALKNSTAPLTITDIANTVKAYPQLVEGAANNLSAKGYNIEIAEHGITAHREGQPQQDVSLCVDSYVADRWIRFGAIGDTHLCNKFARLDVLNALYDIFEKEGIETVYHGGNYIDGENPRFNKGELLTRPGFDAQMNYFIENYPSRDGITTYYIDGDCHEGWYFKREAIIPGKHLGYMAQDAGREDLKYLGYMEADIKYQAPEGDAIVRLLHGGGGSAYADSYKSQKIVESYQGGEKPQVLLISHYHKALFSPKYRNVDVFMVGCTEDQTRFMRGRSLRADIGGWIVEFKQRPDGSICSTRGTFYSFFDRGYHIKHEVTA